MYSSALVLVLAAAAPPAPRVYDGPDAAAPPVATDLPQREQHVREEPAVRQPKAPPEIEVEVEVAVDDDRDRDDELDFEALGAIEEEEIFTASDPEESTDIREIVVTTDLLGAGRRIDVFRHAGGRSQVGVDELRDLGLAGVGDALDRLPGVRAVEGNAGIGSTSTKLNVGVRGANPRLSSEATVMLDEVPIAPAPYGQPQLSLFPLSLFSISRIDAVRGGSSVRFGPRTSGGVFNLISQPIPEHPRIAVFAQTDQFGDAGLATSYGATHRGVGMYFEYAPRFGRTYREHSEFQAHGGLVKLSYAPRSDLDLGSTTHLFSEDSNLPGGLDEKQYSEGNRFRSVRPYDRFVGSRVGTSLRLRLRPRDDHELQVIGFFSHTYRMSVMERQVSLEGEAPTLFIRPRTYNVGGIEPRYAFRVRHRGGAFHDLTLGGRFMYETGRSRECREISPADAPGVYSAALVDTCTGLPLGDGPLDPAIRRDSDARIAAYALYADDKAYLLDTKVVFSGGLRLELAQLAGRNNLSQRALRRFYWELLPAASVWYGPRDELALFAGYGRSFGPSQFLQVDTATSDSNFQLNPELADMVEAGVKLLDLAGFYAELTGWYRYYQDLTDVGETQVDRIAGAHVYGVEAEDTWEPESIWEAAEGVEVTAGYVWTESQISAGQYLGNRLAWYPVHEVWGRASYEFPFGFKLGADVSHNSPQFTDYANRPAGFNSQGSTGEIPAYTLVGAFGRVRAQLPDHWQIEITFGVKNLLNESWFMRTDDENRGILAMRPRTFYFSLGFAHDFFPRGARRARQRARDERREPRPAAAIGRGTSPRSRMLEAVGGLGPLAPVGPMAPAGLGGWL